MNVWLFGFVLLAPLFVFIAVNRNQKRIAAVRSVTVDLRVDEFGAHRMLADGREEGVDWVDLTGVEVVTAKSGPHAAAGGVVMLCGDEEHGCLIPINRLDESGVVEALLRLPGFDMSRLLAALDEAPPKRTVCWERAQA